MTTCFIKYIIDPSKIADFEHYGKLWIDLVNEMGGLHHGYLPHRRSKYIGYASFLFRRWQITKFINKIQNTPRCLEAFKYANDTKCIISYERNFLKPVFEGVTDKAKLFY
jgi:hypothetical protein